jgi:hypothetical protein
MDVSEFCNSCFEMDESHPKMYVKSFLLIQLGREKRKQTEKHKKDPPFPIKQNE